MGSEMCIRDSSWITLTCSIVPQVNIDGQEYVRDMYETGGYTMMNDLHQLIKNRNTANPSCQYNNLKGNLEALISLKGASLMNNYNA